MSISTKWKVPEGAGSDRKWPEFAGNGQNFHYPRALMSAGDTFMTSHLCVLVVCRKRILDAVTTPDRRSF